ncbi:MAG: LON peptidase substrate-binding domain-containing protein [candidate division Zixibacteria bacterium]|nr:LON peptidase substrate-binding domain-containing protein [candidate division Zixibacteria bacterium]
MIIKTGLHIPIIASDGEPLLPIIPAKTLILFPGEVISLQVGRPENLALIQEYTDTDKLIGVTFSPSGDGSKDTDLCQVGTAAKITSVKDGPGGSKMISLEGSRRIALQSIHSETPYLTAKVRFIEEKEGDLTKAAESIEEIIGIIEQITKIDPTYSNELSFVIKFNLSNPGQFADKIATTFHFPLASKQEILESFKLDTRLHKILKFLKAELERAAIAYEIKKNIKERNVDEQKKDNWATNLSKIKLPINYGTKSSRTNYFQQKSGNGR